MWPITTTNTAIASHWWTKVAPVRHDSMLQRFAKEYVKAQQASA